MPSSSDCQSDRSSVRVFAAVALIAATLVGQRAAEQQPQADQKQPAIALPTTAPKNAAELLRAFSTVKALEASYREKKHLSLLAVPLESRGKLYFLAPGHLTRRVEAPDAASLTVTETELRMSKQGQTDVIDLRQRDRVRLFVTSLLRVFRGDQQALQRHYRVAYSTDPADSTRWRLDLTPRPGPLDAILKRLSLAGQGRTVDTIEWLEPNGDRTVTTIVRIDPKRTFTPTERAEIFGMQR